MKKEPFELYTFDGFSTGKIAICRQPNSSNDFQKIKAWCADIIVTMTTLDEFEINNFPEKISHCTKTWMHLPVNDFDIPMENLEKEITQLLEILNSNGRILIHCKGGQGRSGMIAMKLLVEQGQDPQNALNIIREHRIYAVETKKQKNWASNRYCKRTN